MENSPFKFDLFNTEKENQNPDYYNPPINFKKCDRIAPYSFLAIDFETATSKRMACQLGIVVVRYGKIVETRSWLIQPPANKYEQRTINVHGITPEDTEYCKTFDEVWKEASSYFYGVDSIVAHNAIFDSDVLFKNLEYYNIPFAINDFPPFVCTYQIYGKSLSDLCTEFGISENNHHDAMFDALCCAKFYLKYLQDNDPSEANNVIIRKEKDRHVNVDYYAMSEGHDKLSGDVLKKDLTNADPTNVFYDKKVVITGIFDYDRREIAQMLKNLGADIDTSISRKTDFVVVGVDPGPKKIEKMHQLIDDGYPIRPISEEELYKIIGDSLDKI